jgi:hypothetical protein
MELHPLWFEFVCPWLENSVSDPSNGNFKETFDYINTIEDEAVKKMKREQVKTGILAEYKEIIKLSETLLSVPVLFAAR